MEQRLTEFQRRINSTKPYSTIITELVGDHVLVVTLNRPEVGNARNTAMATELLEVWSALAAGVDGILCVVLTGAGEKIFCAGGDLKQRKGMTDAEWYDHHKLFEDGRDKLLQCRVPVIAAVNGHAYGGGCEVSLACDFIYAVKGARMALPEVSRGILPGAGGTQMLPRAVGSRRALEIILSGKPFTTEQAYEWGLVNKLCEREALMSDVLATANDIIGNAPLAVQAAKTAIRQADRSSLEEGFAFELAAYKRLIPTEDRREGVAAFSEKRQPIWKGR